jgi:16S rRNA (cytosine967-C5)-methyltransferase
MTPAARLAATIELLDGIANSSAPADRTVAAYFRARRFVGAKDRGAVSDLTYAVLRSRARLDWWLAKAGVGLPPDGRRRLLAYLATGERRAAKSIEGEFSGSGFAPAILTPEEGELVRNLAGCALADPQQPIHVRGNFPEWVLPWLERGVGEGLAAEIEALARPAPVDLRVNTLKSDREGAAASLQAEGIATTPTPLSPIGLRVAARFGLPALAAFRDGLVEVQDEGSQLASLLVDARPGQRVLDLCAGAGGKTLTIAACMQNKGSIVACDLLPGRLKRAGERFRRAGVHNVQTRSLDDPKNEKWLKRQGDNYDRVLVDAPCTGSGTWRRNPDAPWRLKPDDFTRLPLLQAQLLQKGATHVHKGGRLIYVTCSLFREENADLIEVFLQTSPKFRLLPVGEIWHSLFATECPAAGRFLELTPARHGTDGFFVAVMERALA